MAMNERSLVVLQAWLSANWVSVAVYLGVAALLGLMFGMMRGRWLKGAFYGLLLGPLGWWLILRWEAHGLPCPECGGLNGARARTCRHCRVDLRRAADRSARSRIHARGDGWR